MGAWGRLGPDPGPTLERRGSRGPTSSLGLLVLGSFPRFGFILSCIFVELNHIFLVGGGQLYVFERISLALLSVHTPHPFHRRDHAGRACGALAMMGRRAVGWVYFATFRPMLQRLPAPASGRSTPRPPEPAASRAPGRFCTRRLGGLRPGETFLEGRSGQSFLQLALSWVLGCLWGQPRPPHSGRSGGAGWPPSPQGPRPAWPVGPQLLVWLDGVAQAEGCLPLLRPTPPHPASPVPAPSGRPCSRGGPRPQHRRPPSSRRGPGLSLRSRPPQGLGAGSPPAGCQAAARPPKNGQGDLREKVLYQRLSPLSSARGLARSRC